jgi:hypothetical protein
MKILVHDHGLCLETAITLARAGHDVAYYVTPTDKHSQHSVAQMGAGFEEEGVTKINNPRQVIDTVNLICCFDTHCGDEVDWLRSKGYNVFGAGYQAEQLELDRWHAKLTLKGLPRVGVTRIQGVEALISKLRSTWTGWVKCSGFREIETFKHENWPTTQEQYIAPLLSEYGADPNLVFILEEEISPAQEVGSDNLIVKGEWPVVKPYGYEDKDASYIGRFNSSQLPLALEKVNEAIRLELLTASSFVSTEVRVVPYGAGYPVDLTIRAPHPPMAAMLEALGDIDKLIVDAAMKGTLTQTFPRANYAAVLVGTSGWAEEHRCEITFPLKLRQWVKFMKAYKQGNSYYTLPSTSFTCLVVGIGNDVDQAIKGCKGVAEQVKGRELSFDFSSLDRIRDEMIPQGKKCGIAF